MTGNDKGKGLSLPSAEGPVGTTSATGGVGILLTYLVTDSGFITDVALQDKLVYVVPAISVGLIQSIRYAALVIGKDPHEWRAQRKLNKALKQIKKALKDEHISEQTKQEFRLRYEKLLLMKTDPKLKLGDASGTG